MDEKTKGSLYSSMTIIGILGFGFYVLADLTNSVDKQTLHAICYTSSGLTFMGILFGRWKAGMSHAIKVMLTIMTVLIIAAIIVAIIAAIIGQADTILNKVSQGLILAGMALVCILFFKMEN